MITASTPPLNLGQQAAGIYLDKNGEKVASGLYFYTLKSGSFQATRKMLVIK
jgi:hypothetical protein